MKHFSFRLAVINVCPVLVPSEFLLSTHLPASEGWTAELTVGLWSVVPMTGIRTHASRPSMIRTGRLSHSATSRCESKVTEVELFVFAPNSQ